jgi:hypothetical protein
MVIFLESSVSDEIKETALAKPENRPKFKERTTNPLKVMFKEAALILTAVASLTIANVYAIDSGLLGDMGETLTQINETLTILRVDRDSIYASWLWQTTWQSRTWFMAHKATFYLTNKTAFSGGSRSDAVKGRKIHITYHFEGDRAVADTITFVR